MPLPQMFSSRDVTSCGIENFGLSPLSTIFWVDPNLKLDNTLMDAVMI